MKTTFKIALFALVALFLAGVAGCGTRADENTPIDKIKAEVEKMDVAALRNSAMAYKDKIVAKKGEVEGIAAKIMAIPLADKLGDEAKGLKADVDSLNSSISNLKERFQIYYNKLKEMKGDTSGLSL